MSYGQTSANGTNELSNLSTLENTISQITFDIIWRGSAHTSLTGNLNNVMKKIDAEQAKLVSYFGALNDLETYKQNKEQITKLSVRLLLLPDNKKNAEERASISSQMQSLKETNVALRKRIECVMDLITPVNSEIDTINFNVEFNYFTPISELLDSYKRRLTTEEIAAGERLLQKLDDGMSLANLYNEVDENGNVIKGSGVKYIENVITSVQVTYSGREAAVNSALAMLKLAADKGVKLDYEHRGTTSYEPYVPTSVVAGGVDCNPWTSWVVDKGTPGGFQWRPVKGFYSVGETLNDWTKAQPGDIFVNDGHVGVIIENDPITKIFIVSEETGGRNGAVLQTRTYSNLKKEGYQIRDMTNVYDGTENTDRKVFEQYVDFNTYKRKV